MPTQPTFRLWPLSCLLLACSGEAPAPSGTGGEDGGGETGDDGGSADSGSDQGGTDDGSDDGGTDSGADDGSEDDTADPPDPQVDLSHITSSAWETRLDLDDDGHFDHVWATAGEESSGCTLTLSALADDSLVWTADLPGCSLPYAPLFHWRSFMGDDTPDFTVWVNLGADDTDYWLFAGDGETGVLRDWSLDLGDGNSAGTLRLRGVVTVDYELADHAGASLLVRSTGRFHGRLFHFPDDDTGAVELSADPDIIDSAQAYAAVPFPGADLPGDEYTSLFSAFNWDLDACEEISEVSHYRCGVPDETGGGGYFLDKIAVGDLDGDGVDDAHMSFLWRSVVYPGRPKGQEAWLGAPQLDVYYNPQGDDSDCHSGRHYGLSVLAQLDDDAHLEVLDLAGTPVDNFVDIYQNVSRNLAVQDAGPHGSLPSATRSLSWNQPFGTMIPVCPGEQLDHRLYDGVLHIPSDGRLEDAEGITRWMHANVFSQTSTATECPQNDVDCYTAQLQAMEGSWSWRLLDASDGSTVFEQSEGYVWDVLEDPSGGDPWVVITTGADAFNLGAVSFEDTSPASRTDLAVARLDLDAGELVDMALVDASVKPLLLYEHWQARAGTHTMNFTPLRLAIAPDGDGGLPAFVVRTEEGYGVVSHDAEEGWTLSVD